MGGSDDEDKNTFVLSGSDNALMLDDDDDGLEANEVAQAAGSGEESAEGKEKAGSDEEGGLDLVEASADQSEKRSSAKSKKKHAQYAALGDVEVIKATAKATPAHAAVPMSPTRGTQTVQPRRRRRNPQDKAGPAESAESKLEKLMKPPSRKRRGPFSLAALAAAVTCINVDSYRGGDGLTPELQGALLRITHQHGWLKETNIAFFLHEELEEANLDTKKSHKCLNDMALLMLAICCPKLRSLSIGGWTAVTSKGMAEFCKSSGATNPETLEHLGLNGLYKLDASAFRACVDTFTNLRSLDLSRCSVDWEVLTCLVEGYGETLRKLLLVDVALNSDDLFIITDGFKSLKELDLSLPEWDPDNPAVSTEALSTIGRACGQSLRRLSLCGQPFDDQCMGEITKKCRYLRMLNLSWLDHNSQFPWRVNLTGEGLRSIVDNCQNLRELGLAHCHRIKNDSAIVYMATHLPFLEKLNMTNCQCVTDKAAMMLAENCTKMKRLKLQDCILNSCSIVAFGTFLHELEYLDVRSPNRMNDSAFHKIGEGCKELNTLLANMSPEARLHCQLHCPKLVFRFKNTPTLREVCETELQSIRKR
mmetsp:Transcript_14624/g.57392  ORF Transcript_14624/g.57392 Transcript_14624/m.57392 type:complete len:591 (+) Transcript_14624:191-1963(+)